MERQTRECQPRLSEKKSGGEGGQLRRRGGVLWSVALGGGVVECGAQGVDGLEKDGRLLLECGGPGA